MSIDTFLDRITANARIYLSLARMKKEFEFVTKDKNGQYSLNGKPVRAVEVGPERKAIYFTYHDSWEWKECAVEIEMLVLKYIKKVKTNAAFIDYSRFPEKISYNQALVYFQPLKIESN